ncbi:MAG: DUF4238 domain-containing protein [Rhodospirillaceae bacterium]|nr:DUF4238 domain-containing protein [Rhodospirillaceae bacterium]
MSNHKRNHYVPEHIVERFAHQDGKIRFFDKRRPDRILATSAKNLFVEGHFYTQFSVDGSRDISVEEQLAALDGKAKHVTDHIVSAARRDGSLKLTSDQRAIWDEFFYRQWRRIPEAFQRNDSYVNFDESVDAVVAELEALGRPLTPSERSIVLSQEGRKRIRQNAKAASIIANGDHITSVMAEKGLCVALIRKPTKSFLIGSSPIVKNDIAWANPHSRSNC